jgi:hypothetical protein
MVSSEQEEVHLLFPKPQASAINARVTRQQFLQQGKEKADLLLSDSQSSGSPAAMYLLRLSLASLACCIVRLGQRAQLVQPVTLAKWTYVTTA